MCSTGRIPTRWTDDLVEAADSWWMQVTSYQRNWRIKAHTQLPKTDGDNDHFRFCYETHEFPVLWLLAAATGGVLRVEDTFKARDPPITHYQIIFFFT